MSGPSVQGSLLVWLHLPRSVLWVWGSWTLCLLLGLVLEGYCPRTRRQDEGGGDLYLHPSAQCGGAVPSSVALALARLWAHTIPPLFLSARSRSSFPLLPNPGCFVALMDPFDSVQVCSASSLNSLQLILCTSWS